MAIKKRLTGQDFCDCLPCEERKQIIYPYTLFDTVIIDDTSNSNLYDWLFKDLNGEYLDITDSLLDFLTKYWARTNPFNLPIASSNTLGGIKVGNNLSITADGVLNAVNTTYDIFGSNAGLVPASNSSTKFLRSDGTWQNIEFSNIPIATNDTLGGVIVDDTYLTINSNGLLGLNIDALSIPDFIITNLSDKGLLLGTIITGGDYNIKVPYASADTFGVVKAGRNIIITDGVISVDIGNIIGSISLDNDVILPIIDNNVNIPVFQPSTDINHGIAGLVPAPTMYMLPKREYYLTASGRWDKLHATYVNDDANHTTPVPEIGAVRIGSSPGTSSENMTYACWEDTNKPIHQDGRILKSEWFVVNTPQRNPKRYYAIEVDSAGVPFVNVPWGSIEEINVATQESLGGIKIGFATDESGRDYAVELDSETKKAYVHVPWSSSGISIATDNVVGGFKTGYTQTGKNYPVQISDGKAYVSVPWASYNVVTSSYDGLMSSADKIKLNGISNGAQQNVIEKILVNGTEIRPESKIVNIESYVLMNSEDLHKFFEEIPKEGVYEAKVEGYYLVNTELVKKE